MSLPESRRKRDFEKSAEPSGRNSRAADKSYALIDDKKTMGKIAIPNIPKTEVKPRSTAFYVVLAAASFAFIESFSLLSPILLSFLLILLISLAVNPVSSQMRAVTGGRKVATALIATALVAVIALTSLAFFGPMKTSVAKLSEPWLLGSSAKTPDQNGTTSSAFRGKGPGG